MALGDRKFSMEFISIAQGSLVQVKITHWIESASLEEVDVQRFNVNIPWSDFFNALSAEERASISSIRSKIPNLIRTKGNLPFLATATEG